MERAGSVRLKAVVKDSDEDILNQAITVLGVGVRFLQRIENELSRIRFALEILVTDEMKDRHEKRRR